MAEPCFIIHHVIHSTKAEERKVRMGKCDTSKKTVAVFAQAKKINVSEILLFFFWVGGWMGENGGC